MTTNKCFKCSHAWIVETEPSLRRCGDGETEPMANLHHPWYDLLRANRLLCVTSWIQKSATIFVCCSQIFPYIRIPNYSTSIPVWVCALSSLNRKEKLTLATMKKWENGHHFTKKIIVKLKFQITDPQKFGLSTFHSLDGNGKLTLAITKKWKLKMNQCFQLYCHESPMCNFTLSDIFIYVMSYRVHTRFANVLRNWGW